MPHDIEESFIDVGSLDAMTAIEFIKWSENKFSNIYWSSIIITKFTGEQVSRI